MDTLKKKEKNSAKDLSTDTSAMFLYVFFSSDFLYKSICCGYSFELHQVGTHNICLYKGDKKYTGSNLKITELLDCVLIR